MERIVTVSTAGAKILNEISRVKRLTRYEIALQVAQSYGFEGEEIKRCARHIFAKMIVDGATIGKANGKLVIHKPPRHRPRLP